MPNLDNLRTNLNSSVEHFQAELKKIRAGRANPDLVKGITVMAYGTAMPLEQVSNINVVDATLITLQPWDKTVVPEVVKAIQASDLGINPSVDGNLIRLPIPPLTSERREEYVKVMRQKLEESRINIRQKRKDFLLDVEKEKKENSLPEEEVKRIEEDVQKIVDEYNKKVEEIASAKEKELTTL